MSDIIRCVSCDRDIFRCLAIGRAFAAEVSSAADFVPLVSGCSSPQDHEPMLCPVCGEPFGVRLKDGGVVFKLSSGAWWPYPPPELVEKS